MGPAAVGRCLVDIMTCVCGLMGGDSSHSGRETARSVRKRGRGAGTCGVVHGCCSPGSWGAGTCTGYFGCPHTGEHAEPGKTLSVRPHLTPGTLSVSGVGRPLEEAAARHSLQC